MRKQTEKKSEYMATLNWDKTEVIYDWSPLTLLCYQCNTQHGTEDTTLIDPQKEKVTALPLPELRSITAVFTQSFLNHTTNTGSLLSGLQVTNGGQGSSYSHVFRLIKWDLKIQTIRNCEMTSHKFNFNHLYLSKEKQIIFTWNNHNVDILST